MIRIQVLSDLHTEFSNYLPKPASADILVLAGDIGIPGELFFTWLSYICGFYNSVLYVPGNHEYYHSDVATVEAQLAGFQHPAYHYMQKGITRLGGLTFVGCTLWTDLSDSAAATYAYRSMYDYQTIRQFSPGVATTIHQDHVAWLTALNSPNIVITHHLPTYRSVAPRYAGDPLNPAFATPLDDLIVQLQPQIWIHGHTHVACDYQYNEKTRIVCNPRGYVRSAFREANTGFDPYKVIEL